MRAILLLLALALTGCATSRVPGSALPPVTLDEVNDTLDGRRALVTFAGGRTERAYAFVGSEQTVLRVRGPVGTRTGARTDEVTVPTEGIATIEVDNSLSVGQGAGRGALIGATPGVALTGIIVGALVNCTDWCWTTPLLLGGAIVTATGSAMGAGTGAVVASSKDFAVVYRAPVTRYPDAALALMDGEATRGPLAEQAPTPTPTDR